MQKKIIASLLALLTAHARAAPEKTFCPLRVPAAAVTMQAPEGWLASSPTDLLLSGGGIISGAPAERGVLIPESMKKAKHGNEERYLVSGEKWFFCNYGRTRLQLVKRMNDDAEECTIVYTEGRGQTIKSMYAYCPVPGLIPDR